MDGVQGFALDFSGCPSEFGNIQKPETWSAAHASGFVKP
jgi:hypothetical protein